jgi:hypothetical protein
MLFVLNIQNAGSLNIMSRVLEDFKILKRIYLIIISVWWLTTTFYFFVRNTHSFTMSFNFSEARLVTVQDIISYTSWYSLKYPDLQSVFIFNNLGLKVLGILSNAGVNFLVLNFLLGFGSFLILGNIISRYIDYFYAFPVAGLGLMTVIEFPMRTFLQSFKSANISYRPEYYLPEIFKFPFPSISTFFLLLGLYFTLQRKYFSPFRIIVVTIYWILQLLIYTPNFVFGFLIFYSILVYQIFRNKTYKQFGKFLSLFILLGLGLLFLVVILVNFDSRSLDFISPTISLLAIDFLDSTTIFYYLFIYFIFPNLFLLFLLVLRKVDLYEIIFKFWFIYLLQIIELIIILALSIAPNNFTLLSFFIRTVIPIFHILYFIPLLFFIGKLIRLRRSTTTSAVMLRLSQVYFIFPYITLVLLTLYVNQISNFNDFKTRDLLDSKIQSEIDLQSTANKILQDKDFACSRKVYSNKMIINLYILANYNCHSILKSVFPNFDKQNEVIINNLKLNYLLKKDSYYFIDSIQGINNNYMDNVLVTNRDNFDPLNYILINHRLIPNFENRTEINMVLEDYNNHNFAIQGTEFYKVKEFSLFYVDLPYE